MIPGAEPLSHIAGDGAPGALVLHGFTGNPGSVRILADAFVTAGRHVELPRLPGHGTTVEDMLTTRWQDWATAAADAHRRLRERTDRIVVAGLSMGGALALWLAGSHPEIDGLICINPLTMLPTADLLAMLDDLLAGGETVLAGIGSDIADPNAHETAYPGTPLEPLRSLLHDGVAHIETSYDSLQMPLLLMNSPEDHVVDPANSEHLASHFGGPVRRVILEHSYHVATQDYDKELIVTESLAFAERVTAR